MNDNVRHGLPSIDMLPVLDGAAPIDCGENTRMVCIEDASASSYVEYCARVSEVGFENIFSREDSGNMFNAFVGDKEYAYVYYTDCNGQMRIITGPRGSLPKTDYSSDYSETADAYMATVPQPGDGNGFIIRMPDGRFLIVDSGYREDDRIYKVLRQLEKGKIVIAAWFISHPHGDHYPALLEFLRGHYGDDSVTVERVIHNFAHHEMYNITGSAGMENNGRDVNEFYGSIKKYAPDLPVLKAHNGQIINFGSATAEILYTVEDLLPRRIRNINNTSMVVRIDICGHRLMMLGDTCYDSAPIMIDIWGDRLRSDIMQVAHHGIWPSVKELYEAVQGKVAIFPAKKNNLSRYIRDPRWEASTKAILNYAEDIYISCDSIEIIELPYALKNNKEQVLGEL